MLLSRKHRFSLTSAIRSVMDMNQHDLLYTDLDRLAAVVAEFGIDVVEPALVDALADRALARGASATLAGIVTDPTEPAAARIRAFGRLAMVAARPAPAPVLTAA